MLFEKVNQFFGGCPAVNARRFLITADGKPFASFDSMDEATKVRDMYRVNVRGQRNPTKNSLMNWEVKDQGARL